MEHSNNFTVYQLEAAALSSAVEVIFRIINNNDYKLVNLLSKIKVRYIDISDIEQFRNINSHEDLL